MSAAARGPTGLGSRGRTLGCRVMPEGLSLVLPAYNEQENVVTAVERSLNVLTAIGIEHEVIVVDDGSQDQTSTFVQSLVDQHHPRVRLMRHLQNQGYGAAIRTGFASARYDLIFYTDADNQFDVDELKWFLPLMEEYDLAIGF